MNFGDPGADYYSFNVVSPQISYVEAWIPHVTVLGDVALIHGISVLILKKKQREDLSLTLCQARTEPGRGLSWDTKSVGAWTSQPLELWEITFIV